MAATADIGAATVMATTGAPADMVETEAAAGRGCPIDADIPPGARA
eukprot:CAMPEP_0175537428 /NCGR_PEP_ID=MMETSP0096-20121207/25213_1 /TAXON_ID=311494 /ORGANISM="Alexandrium monilatum, Strain CCMP3105" /LENGTH=45 /DNA_ID= /DNA_START= /DNA_END= /DNA_ORIENTATION=